jgi:eukaryotic-like serine/threonine-protein kinase
VGRASAPTDARLRSEGTVAALAAPAVDGTPALALRLEAIAQTCEAVAATHGVGVVHKDLKPANVLVRTRSDGRPQIRLADFGIGALTDTAAIEALGITQLGFTRTRGDKDSSSGTPLYLAPEVIGGQMPTQRSDIYALGVMLYQAIVADPRKPLAPGWERDVDDELLREDIAAAADVDPEQRLGDAAELARRLRGLEARRQKRQAEAHAQSEAARLRDALARARVRRRRLAWASALMLVVLAVVSVMALQMRIAQQQARVEAETATAVNDFLLHDLLAQANPLVAGRRDVGVRELLDAAAVHVGARFADRPGSEAGVRLALGSAYRNLAEYDSAALQLETAFELTRRRPEAERFREPLALELAALNVSRERYDEVALLLEPLLEHPDPLLAAQAALTLARADEKTGDYDRSMLRVELALARVEGDSALAASALGQKGVTLIAMGRYADAIEVNRAHLAAKRRLFGAGDIRTLEAVRSTALSLYYAEQFEASLGVYQEAYRLASEVLGPEHDQTLVVAADVALLHQETGQLERAETIMRETLETRLRLYGEDSRDVRTLLNNIGVLYGEMGDRERELEFLRRAWQAEVRAAGEAHPDALVSAHNVARALLRMGRHAEAEPLQRHTLETAIASLGADHPYIGIMNQILAQIIGHLGQFDEAEQRVADAIALLEATLGPEHSMSERARTAQSEIQRMRAQAGQTGSNGT